MIAQNYHDSVLLKIRGLHPYKVKTSWITGLTYPLFNALEDCLKRSILVWTQIEMHNMEKVVVYPPFQSNWSDSLAGSFLKYSSILGDSWTSKLSSVSTIFCEIGVACYPQSHLMKLHIFCKHGNLNKEDYWEHEVEIDANSLVGMNSVDLESTF